MEGLLAPDTHAKYVPVLATEVPTVQNGGIVLSPDGKTMKITYKLRPNVKWHDGKPFTSADVKFTWEAVKDPSSSRNPRMAPPRLRASKRLTI